MTAAADAAEYALALLDLGRGRWSDALDRLDGVGDPVLQSVALPERVEAAARAGRRDEADAALAAAAAAGVCSPSRVAACRALLADGDEAAGHFEHALALAAGARPFDRARVQLLCGEHLRRTRRRADARPHLRAALETFEALRAGPWCERARAELEATCETARERDPSTLDALTPQEAKVAGFVAEGLSNRDVATRLFLSPRTIDAHLRSVFAKLGVSSRTQLARRFPGAGAGAGGALAFA